MPDIFKKYPALIAFLIVGILVIDGFVAYEIYYNSQNEVQQLTYETLNQTAWIADRSDRMQSVPDPAEVERAYRAANEAKMQEFLAACENPGFFEPYLNGGPDFEVYRQVNRDVVGYVLIPDTKIDYPVLRSEIQRDYYLKRNLDGSTGYPGSIFMEDINSPGFDDPVTVLYGHNMKNGTMFAQIHDLHNSAAFREAHKYIFTYQEDSVSLYEIVACTAYSDRHLLADNFVKDESGEFVYTQNTADDPARMWSSLKEYGDTKAYFAKDAPAEGDRYIALSTCGSSKVRVVAVGKLLFTHWY